MDRPTVAVVSEVAATAASTKKVVLGAALTLTVLCAAILGLVVAGNEYTKDAKASAGLLVADGETVETAQSMFETSIVSMISADALIASKSVRFTKDNDLLSFVVTGFETTGAETKIFTARNNAVTVSATGEMTMSGRSIVREGKFIPTLAWGVAIAAGAAATAMNSVAIYKKL